MSPGFVLVYVFYMKVFLDDCRDPSWVYSFSFDLTYRSSFDFLAFLREGTTSLISLDYDLGVDVKSGMDVALEVRRLVLSEEVPPLLCLVHTADRGAKRRMETVLEDVSRAFSETVIDYSFYNIEGESMSNMWYEGEVVDPDVLSARYPEDWGPEAVSRRVKVAVFFKQLDDGSWAVLKKSLKGPVVILTTEEAQKALKSKRDAGRRAVLARAQKSLELTFSLKISGKIK